MALRRDPKCREVGAGLGALIWPVCISKAMRSVMVEREGEIDEKVKRPTYLF